MNKHIQFLYRKHHICKEYLDEYSNIYLHKYKLEKKDTINTYIKSKKYLIKLTVSVGWEKIQFGSLHAGQFLHLTFFDGILFSSIFFCSSGVILLKASTSIKFFFCSSVNSALLLFSPLFSSFSFPSFAPSPSWISLFSSVASFSVFCSPSGLFVFFVGNFFLNLLKN